MKFLTEAFGLNGMTTIITLFDRMEVAENEIAAGMVLHQDHAVLINRSFVLMMPSEYIPDFIPDELYAKHVDELIDRIVKSMSMSLPTKVETAMAFSHLALEHMLTNDAICAYMRLMIELFDNVPEEIVSIARQESYKGAADQALSDVQTKMRKNLLWRDSEWSKVLDELKAEA